jgi:hypothetical protein
VPVVSVLAVLLPGVVVDGVVVDGVVVVSGVVEGVVAGSVRAVSSARLQPATTASDNAAASIAILLGFIWKSPHEGSCVLQRKARSRYVNER